MGRRKSLESQLVGKPLAEVKRTIRNFEKRLLDDAIRNAGECILEIYQRNSDDPFFAGQPGLKKALDDLAEVRPKAKRRPHHKSRGPGVSVPEKTIQTKRSEYQPAGFVPDIADEDL